MNRGVVTMKGYSTLLKILGLWELDHQIVSYPEHSMDEVSYPWAERLSTYSTVPAGLASVKQF